MSINISSRKLDPLRLNYAHIERRFGNKKPASRYQEAVYDLQPTENFHYPPTWEPDKQLFDESRTAIKMQDWYAFADPRQYYYTTYVTARAKQQESMENNFSLIEKSHMLDAIPETLKSKIKQVLTPLRHVEYGANMNNQDICDRGYGASITSLASFNGFDRVAIAQYISRITLLLDNNETAGLDQGKSDWMDAEEWQGLRHAMEDIFVLDDWFEIMVAQNVVMDGIVYPLIFRRFVDEAVSQGAMPMTLMTQLMNDWYAETVRWTNQLIKVTAKESDANQQLLSHWANHWIDRLQDATTPLAKLALENEPEQQLGEVVSELKQRLQKQGLTV